MGETTNLALNRGGKNDDQPVDLEVFPKSFRQTFLWRHFGMVDHLALTVRQRHPASIPQADLRDWTDDFDDFEIWWPKVEIWLTSMLNLTNPADGEDSEDSEDERHRETRGSWFQWFLAPCPGRGLVIAAVQLLCAALQGNMQDVFGGFIPRGWNVMLEATDNGCLMISFENWPMTSKQSLKTERDSHICHSIDERNRALWSGFPGESFEGSWSFHYGGTGGYFLLWSALVSPAL